MVSLDIKTKSEIPDPFFSRANFGRKTSGWRAAIDKLRPELKKAARAVDTIINAPDFRKIDEEDWK